MIESKVSDYDIKAKEAAVGVLFVEGSLANVYRYAKDHDLDIASAPDIFQRALDTSVTSSRNLEV